MSTSTPGGRAFPRQSETKRSSLMDARKYDNDDRMDHDTEDDAPERDGWIGVDFAHLVTPPSSRSWVPLVALALLAALGVSALRIDLIRTRYALAETMATEKSMIQDQRDLIVRQRRLRDPAVLTALARERGFRPILAAQTLPDPMPHSESTRGLPSVAAGPPPRWTPNISGAVAR